MSESFPAMTMTMTPWAVPLSIELMALSGASNGDAPQSPKEPLVFLLLKGEKGYQGWVVLRQQIFCS